MPDFSPDAERQENSPAAIVPPEKLERARRVLRQLLPCRPAIQIVAEGGTARLRTGENHFLALMMKRDVVVPVLLDAGFDHVALDLEGLPEDCGGGPGTC